VSNHPERVADYLQHILDAIERAITYAAQAGSVDAFKGHPLLQDGIVRNVEVIGEAAIKLHKVAPDIASAHPDIPWKDMRTMRNKLIHDYFDVDLDIVWSTVQRDLPVLATQIRALLTATMPRHEGD
jgi:uncharacterized protein with HEPN domain